MDVTHINVYYEKHLDKIEVKEAIQVHRRSTSVKKFGFGSKGILIFSIR